MKIDFDMLDKMEAAGASAKVIITFLKEAYARGETKRKRDKENKIVARAGLGKRATKRDNERHERNSQGDKARQDATFDDSPRARLFREGSEILAALGRSDRGARALLSQWLKLTGDDSPLVLASLARARDLGVADVAGWMLTTLNAKVKNGTGTRSLATAADDLIARTEEFSLEGGPVIDHERH